MLNNIKKNVPKNKTGEPCDSPVAFLLINFSKQYQFPWLNKHPELY